MLARDEEENIGRAIKSAVDVADEIVVVDTGSQDGTVRIAKELGARVFEREWPNDFGQARNMVAGLAANDWVLHLDADEELGETDPARLASLLSTPDVDAYWLQTVHLTKPGTAVGSVSSRSLKFFRKSKYMFRGVIHEQAGPIEPGAARCEKFSGLKVIHWGFANASKVAARADRNTAMLERVLADDPGNFMLLFFLGVELANSKRYPEAIEKFKQAESLLPHDAHEHRAQFLLHLCEALGHADRVEEGLNYGEIAAKKFPDYRDLLYVVGELSLMAGRTDRAADYFQRCAQMPNVSGRYLTAREGLDKRARRKLRRLRPEAAPGESR